MPVGWDSQMMSPSMFGSTVAASRGRRVWHALTNAKTASATQEYRIEASTPGNRELWAIA